MRKVFLDNLPTKKYGNTFRIDWMKSIGSKIRFTYDDLDGEIEIVGFNNKKSTPYMVKLNIGLGLTNL